MFKLILAYHFFLVACVCLIVWLFLVPNPSCSIATVQNRGGGGVLRISSDRDDRRIFLGLKVSISGWVEKFWQVFFWAAWFKKGFFWAFKIIWTFVIVISFNAFWKFLWLGNSAWDFFWFKFWPRDIFWFWFLPPFNHPCHLQSLVYTQTKREFVACLRFASLWRAKTRLLNINWVKNEYYN